MKVPYRSSIVLVRYRTSRVRVEKEVSHAGAKSGPPAITLHPAYLPCTCPTWPALACPALRGGGHRCLDGKESLTAARVCSEKM